MAVEAEHSSEGCRGGSPERHGIAGRSPLGAPCRRGLRTLQLGLWLALLPGTAGFAQPINRDSVAPPVALMGRERALPLRGTFNNVPVLHSNQPEEVIGPGILVDTSPGALWSETGQTIANPTYRFNGPFGLHLHHHYSPGAAARGRRGQRPELTLAAVMINPGPRPVQVSLLRGAVRNSFEAPYQGHQLLGVKPLGPRPWNTGPGDATAVQMLRERLDANLNEKLSIPAHGRVILLRTVLPAEGVANALVRGESDGPFDLAVVAAPAQADSDTLLAVLDQHRLAPGRTYLNQQAAIANREVFSRVSGVAIGDAYQASLRHDLSRDGALHVPLTTTSRQSFGTGEIQVNGLASRMPDSALDNVGTYGVRFDLDLHLRGSGPYAVVLSHPPDPSGRTFIAFRGSIQLRRPSGQEDLHVGLRSGESLELTTLQLEEGQEMPLHLSLVYPADSTPGHLLSVVPLSQLADRRSSTLLRNAPLTTTAAAQPTAQPVPRPMVSRKPAPRTNTVPAPAVLEAQAERTSGMAARSRASRGSLPANHGSIRPLRPPADLIQRRQGMIATPPILRPSHSRPEPLFSSLADRYRQALDAQERLMRSWQAP